MIIILELLQNTHAISTQLSKYSKRLPKELREGINFTITADIPLSVNTIIKRINKDNGYTAYPEIDSIEAAIRVLNDKGKFESCCMRLTPESIEIINNEKEKLMEQEHILALCLKAIKLPDL